VPAAGAAARLQPLAFSKEMLPVGSTFDERGVERPRAVSEFLVERMLNAGADRICVVLSPDKYDIIPYYARHPAARRFCYVVQEQPNGLCDALFRAAPVLHEHEDVLIGLPDTVWFPVNGFCLLPAHELAFLLFHVDQPERFDAVVTQDGDVTEIQVKARHPSTAWVWGAFRMPAVVFRALHRLWLEPERGDEYVGTLVNAYLRRGGRAVGVPAGQRYFDVGTVDGYRAAIDALRPDSLARWERVGTPSPRGRGERHPPGARPLPLGD
jgi:dTDP-glucose pyrophosphorylase